jgi:hypothetical protein
MGHAIPSARLEQPQVTPARYTHALPPDVEQARAKLAAYRADAQKGEVCGPMRFRSLCRSLDTRRPYFTGDFVGLRRSRKPVRVFRSDEGSNPSLSVSRQVRAFLPHGRPADRLPPSAFPAPTFPRLPHGRPLVHRRWIHQRGGDQCAGLETGASRPPSIVTTTRYPAITERRHMRTAAYQGAARMSWALTSPQRPPATPGAGLRPGLRRRTSPQDRRTAPRRSGCLCPSRKRTAKSPS